MHRTTLHRQPLAVAVGLMVTGGFSQHAVAQDVDDIALEEITVTAQKREESLLETPIAITTLDNFQLEQINATALTDLNGYVPAFRTTPFAADAGAPNVFIRGMGSIDVQTTKDPAVGVYLDGVVLGRATGRALDVADLERIEVLRGPQGTLYGRNTTAGAINYVTRKPHDEWAFKQRFTVGNYNQWASQTDLNIPVTDNFYLKLGYMRTATDGWVENENVSGLSGQADPNQNDNEAATIAMRWRATDNFTLDYAFDYSDMKYGNGYYQTVQSPTVGSSDDRKDKAGLQKGFDPSTQRTKGHNLTLTWDLGGVTLKSITGYRELNADVFQNYLDGEVYPPPFPLSSFIQSVQIDQDQFSQEFQVIGDAFSDSVQYVAGLYYYREESTEDQLSNFGFPPGTSATPFDVLDVWSVDAEAESKAIYGQATWRPNSLSQKLGLTLGLRYTEDDREATKNFIVNQLDPTAPTGKTTGKNDFSNTSVTAIVDYFFTDNINSYLKYATGYRAGGFSTRSLPADFARGFDPEDVQSWELGFKSQLWEQRLTLNAAAYYNSYDDLQQSAIVESPIFPITLNAAEATIQGAEVELIARLSRGWTLDTFYAYIDADYDEFVLPDGRDISDTAKLPNAPRHQSKLGAEYAFPMTNIGQVTARVDYLWQDEWFSNKDETSQNDAYGMLNARLQWLAIPLPKGDIRVALWGRNLTDEEYTTITTDFTASSAPGLQVASQYGMPRTYGIDFIYEY
jgi:iron complex outermembrane receptor protein